MPRSEIFNGTFWIPTARKQGTMNTEKQKMNN